MIYIFILKTFLSFDFGVNFGQFLLDSPIQTLFSGSQLDRCCKCSQCFLQIPLAQTHTHPHPQSAYLTVQVFNLMCFSLVELWVWSLTAAVGSQLPHKCHGTVNGHRLSAWHLKALRLNLYFSFHAETTSNGISLSWLWFYCIWQV